MSEQSDNRPSLNECFSFLHMVLDKIKNDPKNSDISRKENVIESIKENEFFSFDNEDIIAHLDYYLTEIQTIKEKIPKILLKTHFEDKISESKEFPFSLEIILTARQVKAKCKRDLLLELNYYYEKLTEFKEEITNQMLSLGSNAFANAGYKIKLQLSVGAIGKLFGKMLELRLIGNKISTQKNLTKNELASFLAKNFDSKTSQDKMSKRNLENAMSPGKIDNDRELKNFLQEIINSIK